MDPIEVFPLEIVELMFTFLSGKELLNKTLVNRVWNNFIGNSRKCMEKLKLKISPFKNQNSLEILGTQRQHVNLDCCLEFSADCLEKVISLSQQWKSVEVYKLQCRSTNQLHAVMRKIEATVENLGLIGFMINSDEEPAAASFSFKKLKTLTIMHNKLPVPLSIFQTSPLLTSLTVRGNYDISIIDFMKQHDKLSRLSTDIECFDIIFSSNIQDFKFKLKKFIVSNDCSPQRSSVEAFKRFLVSQADTIENFQANEWCDIETVFKMKNLKNLRLVGFNLPGSFELLKNNSLETLDVTNLDGAISTLDRFLIATPNLKHIRMRCINEGLAKFIIENVKKLQTISTVHGKTKDVKKMLEDFMPNVLWESEFDV